MDNEYVTIIFVMENQDPITLKIHQQTQIQKLLSVLKKKSIEKQTGNSFQTREIVIMIPSSESKDSKEVIEDKPKVHFFASSAFQCAPEAHMLPMPHEDFFI